MRTVPYLFLSLHPQDFNPLQDITQHIWRVRSVRFDVDHTALLLLELGENPIREQVGRSLANLGVVLHLVQHISPRILFPVKQKMAQCA
jgi:hypothetical protein